MRSALKMGARLLAERRGFISFLGILLALALSSVLCYFMVTSYFKKPALDKATAGVVQESGIDTSGYSTIINSTRSKLHDLEKQQELQYKDVGQQ
ncbi:MAG: hypothetical protein HQL22_10455 [Candidatus Omnitrophica bacterium]|nr:hypothetical protein [Candidatus Omnitrophota bacterium]